MRRRRRRREGEAENARRTVSVHSYELDRGTACTAVYRLLPRRSSPVCDIDERFLVTHQQSSRHSSSCPRRRGRRPPPFVSGTCAPCTASITQRRSAFVGQGLSPEALPSLLMTAGVAPKGSPDAPAYSKDTHTDTSGTQTCSPTSLRPVRAGSRSRGSCGRTSRVWSVEWDRKKEWVGLQDHGEEAEGGSAGSR